MKEQTATIIAAAPAESMQPVLHSFTYALDFLREQLADVDSDEITRQPEGVVNHPAWTVGHLVFACQLLGSLFGLAEWLPKDWAKRYGPGSAPVADRDVYESKDVLLEALGTALSKLVGAVEQADEAFLDMPFPDKAYLEVFPTVRHALTQVLVGHAAFHVGQIAVWRRAMNLPPMRRSFE